MIGIRRLPRSLVVCLLISLAGMAVQVAGDSRVADAMWRTTADAPTAGSDAGHGLAGLGDLVVLLSGFGFALAAAVSRRVRPGLAGLAAVMVIIPPPFLWPGAGVLMVLLHALTTGRSLAATQPDPLVPFTKEGTTTMSNHSHRRALVPLAIAATAVLLSAGPAGAGAPTRARGAGQLRDLLLTTAEPTDHATAQVEATESGGTTTVTLKVQGLDHAAAGTELGAHVHSGSCVEGMPADAGPHYNTTGGSSISDQTEVWLDFTVRANGTGTATATVPFTIPPGGAGAVVIHATHTDHTTGAAGPRWACLPVRF